MKGKIFTRLKRELPKVNGKNNQKIYFNHKTNELVLENTFIPSITSSEEPSYLKVSKEIPMCEHTDTYIGVALLICQHLFGSNTKYRKWVDEYFVGKRPEEFYQESEEAIKEYELEKILSALCSEQNERQFEVGQRVLFLLEGREYVGIIFEKNPNNTYNVEFNDEIVYGVRNNQIIRKMRRPNRKKDMQ